MCDQPTLGMLASHHWIGTAGKLAASHCASYVLDESAHRPSVTSKGQQASLTQRPRRGQRQERMFRQEPDPA
jgi:hypothetical protein